MGMCKTYCEKYGDGAIVLARLLIGLLFFLHGWQKFAGGMASGLFGVAAVLEVVIGAAVFLGLFTRLAATVGAVEMVVAYFMMHASGGLSPLANKGEAALLFFAAFLLFSKLGNGAWSLEQMLLKKETF